MKDHQIAILVNALTKELCLKFPMLPQCLRVVISEIVVANLRQQKLKIDP